MQEVDLDGDQLCNLDEPMQQARHVTSSRQEFSTDAF